MFPINHRIQCISISLLVWVLYSIKSEHAMSADDSNARRTYCNPISLPNYPLGKFARGIERSQPAPTEWQWRLGFKDNFRELADVSALWFEGKWYLYPSVDMAWVSDDLGATWQHHPLNVRDLGYAPTIVRYRAQFLLMASDSSVYSAKSPLGPFVEVGRIELSRTQSMSGFIDPMLFSDDDNRLFYYWGCSPTGGIWGVELDATNPLKVLGKPTELIPFRPDEHPWEAVGEWNQNPRVGWIEGAWMLKHNGTYYLTYSAGGTENRTYAMGCYVGTSPLGPFAPQKHNPILRTTDGLVTGTAHGCVVSGPNDELWTFYTVRAGVVHAFERRLGMDRAEIDSHGQLRVLGATSLPQPLPVTRLLSDRDQPQPVTALNWLPLNGEMRTFGSSEAANLPGRFAVDNDMRTWWQPADDEAVSSLTTYFMAPATVYASRVIWRDVGLDPASGIQAGPIRYRIELETGRDQWKTLVDRSKSDVDLLIDYRECTPTNGTRAKLVILDHPKGIVPAVAEFTLFGKTIRGD